MTIHFGNVPVGSVLPIVFSTFDGGTGASITLTGLAVTDVEIYKGTTVTQRSSDVGVALIDTDGIDIDGITGIHGFSIDTGDDTDAGFYAVGSFFRVIVSAVTIDAQTVNFIAATFRLVAAEAVAGKPKADVDAWLGTAVATPTVNGVPEVDLTHVAGSTTSVSALASGVATLLADWNDGGRLDLILDIIAADTTTDIPALIAAIDTLIDSIIAAVITNAAGVDIAADIIALKAETALIVADTNELQVDDTPGALAALDTLIDSIIAAVITNAAGTDVAADIIALKTVADTIATDTTTDLPATLAAIQARLKGLVIHEGTIGSTGNDLTHLHLDGLTYGNDEINGYLLVVFDVSESEYHHREITDWVLATELATVATLPFTPENAVDTYWLLGTLGSASLTGGDATEAKQDAIIALLPTALSTGGFMKADVEAWKDGTVVVVNTTGVPKVDVVQFLGGGQTVTDLKHFADTGYDPATSKVAGVVLADAVTVVNGLAADVITATSIQDGALAAAKFAAGAFDAVWSVAARLLTAGTNIVLAKGVGVTGFNDLSAAQVNAEADTALADYDGPTNAELTTAQAAVIDGVLDGVRVSKNTALAGFTFFMRDSADGGTGKTGLTITATRSLDGAAFGACANAASEISAGWYTIDLAAADLNANVIGLNFDGGAGAFPAAFTVITQPKD